MEHFRWHCARQHLLLLKALVSEDLYPFLLLYFLSFCTTVPLYLMIVTIHCLYALQRPLGSIFYTVYLFSKILSAYFSFWWFDHVWFLAPLTRRSAQRSWWYYWFVRRRPSSVVRRRPSVNFCFKSLLLLQFLFDHSDFFTGETRHIVPPCNKAGISNFCLELQKLQKFQISWKRYSSFSSYSIILKFILEKLGI